MSLKLKLNPVEAKRWNEILRARRVAQGKANTLIAHVREKEERRRKELKSSLEADYSKHPHNIQKRIKSLLEKQAKGWNKDRQACIDRMVNGTKKKPRLRKEVRLNKIKAATHALKVERKKAAGKPTESFYDTREWQALRFKVILKYGRTCMACGKVGGEMHVDHIKPRSKYPELELEFDNLQILCRPCNLGKSNTYECDFRPY